MCVCVCNYIWKVPCTLFHIGGRLDFIHGTKLMKLVSTRLHLVLMFPSISVHAVDVSGCSWGQLLWCDKKISTCVLVFNCFWWRWGCFKLCSEARCVTGNCAYELMIPIISESTIDVSSCSREQLVWLQIVHLRSETWACVNHCFWWHRVRFKLPTCSPLPTHVQPTSCPRDRTKTTGRPNLK